MRRVWVRRTLLLVIVAVVLVGAWTAWQAWQVNRDLNDAVDAVDRARAAAEAGDATGLDAAIDDLTASSEAAAERTDGLTWSALTHLPRFGDDARGVRVVSSVVRDLAVDGARPLAEVSDDLDQLLPRDSQVSVDALTGLQAPVTRAEQALAVADDRLAGEDPSGFVMRLREQYRDLAGTVRDTHRALSSAATALDVLPAMLGAEGPRNYLLVFQNNAEIRATGGLPGSVALITTDDGRIELGRQVAGNSLSSPTSSILPLSEAEDALFADLIGRYFVNANLTPDFPRTSELMRAWWEGSYPEQVDGVLSVDPVALSFILAVTGPVEVGGVSLDADNVVDELLHGVYLRYEDPAEQDAFFQQVARTAFEQVLSGADDPQALVRALGRAADQSRLYVHSFDPDEQAALAGTAVAGELVTAPTDDPQVTVALNDSTGAKMSYFLRYDVDVQPTSCGDGVQSYTGSAVLESTAPADAASLPDYITGGGLLGAPPGTEFVNVNLFAPAGGSVTDLRVNAQRIEPAVIDYDGRPTDTVAVQLEPGQKVRVGWRMTSGAGQTGPTTVSVTPGIEDRDYSSKVPTAC